MHFYDLFAPETREEIKAAAFGVFGRGEPFRAFLNWNVRRDGRIVALETSGVPILDANGRLLGYRGADTDVTERKRAEEALKTSEEKYRALVETTGTGYLICDREGKVLDANREYVRLTGHRELGEILGRSVIEWTAAHEKQKNAEAVARCAKDGFVRDFVVDYVNGNNCITPVEVNATVIGSGESLRIVALCRDITERKRVEEDLRKKEHLLSESQRVAHIGSWSFDPTSQSLVWTDETYAIYGVSPDTFTPSVESVIGLIHPDDRRAMQEWIGATAAGDSAGLLEFRAVRPDGSIRILSGQGEMVFSIDTHTALMVGTVQDITERKRAEEALRRSEARWNAAIENLGAGVVIATDTEQVIYRNPAARAMHGFTSDQGGVGPLQDMTRIFQLWTPDGRLLPLDEWPLRRIKHGEILNRLELRLRRLDQGWEKIISYSGAMVESAIGERLMFVSAQDLTDQRKAEHSLRESEERLRLLGDHLPDSAVYQYVDEPGVPVRYTYFSAGIERLNGVTVEGVLRDQSTLHSQILPEHMDRFVEAKSRSKRDLSDFDIEVPMRRADGEIRWIHFHSRPRRLPDGRTIWDGVQTDVTAHKQAEDALKKQAELLKLSYDAMIVWKLDGAIESWNVGAERLYGYSEAEAVGKLTDTLLAPQFPKPWGEILKEMRTAGSWEGELRQQTRDRREVVVSARIQLIKGSDGIDRVLEVNRDVTEARRAQFEAFARQKLESLGTLASGIAHDFNNLLGAVLAQAELAAAGLAGGVLSARGIGGYQGGRDPWFGHRPSTDDLCGDRE